MTLHWPWAKPKLYRHGDLLLRQVDEIPESATQLSTNIIAHGENGNTHKLHGSHQVYETPDKQILFTANQDVSLKQRCDASSLPTGDHYGITIIHKQRKSFLQIE